MSGLVWGSIRRRSSTSMSSVCIAESSVAIVSSSFMQPAAHTRDRPMVSVMVVTGSGAPGSVQ
ncbi:Uncharacterised protein [Mycobacteroides abscessus subsp. abscessus]|nr:Uncharacterised protein [Mycobacteroides abscessus subsp. abscessus]